MTIHLHKYRPTQSFLLNAPNARRIGVSTINSIKKVNCLHPVIILNPLAPELISRFGNFTIKGREYQIKPTLRYLYEFKIPYIHPRVQCVEHCDLDSCFIVDSVSNERYPLYMEVPCGHCECCQSSKMNAFVHRCLLETASYDCLPIFLTLTYNNENLPKDGKVSVRDVQLFLKRLRINLERHGYAKRIRYVVASEYGKLGRPHYHLILWNLGQTDILSYSRIGDLIDSSWNKGFTRHRLVRADDSTSFKYTAKYLFKDCVTSCPEGEESRPTFLLSSNRGGGIGSRLIDALAEHCYKTLDTELKFVNRLSGKVVKVQFNRYVLNRIFPTLSRSMSSELRTSLRTFFLNYSILKQRHSINLVYFDKDADLYSDFFAPYCYFGKNLTDDAIPLSSQLDDDSITINCLQAEKVIDDYMRKGYEYYQRAASIARIRDKFIEKLFKVVHEVPLSYRAELFRSSLARTLNRQVL